MTRERERERNKFSCNLWWRVLVTSFILKACIQLLKKSKQLSMLHSQVMYKAPRLSKFLWEDVSTLCHVLINHL